MNLPRKVAEESCQESSKAISATGSITEASNTHTSQRSLQGSSGYALKISKANISAGKGSK
jgi:hypothetical protein